MRRNQFRTLNDFQKLLGDINWLWPTIGLTTQELSNLFQTLQSIKDLNSPRKLSAEARKGIGSGRKEVTGYLCALIDPKLDGIYFSYSALYSFSHRNLYTERLYFNIFSTKQNKNLKTYSSVHILNNKRVVPT